MPSKNRSPSTLYVPGNVTMETGKDFGDLRGGPFNINIVCGLAMRIVSLFGGLALIFCFPFNNESSYGSPSNIS